MATQSIPGPNSSPDNQSFQILSLKKIHIGSHICLRDEAEELAPLANIKMECQRWP